MRKLRAPAGAGEKLGVLALEAAALMSRAAGLWRALGDAPLARLRGEAVRMEGARRLVADDDAALLSLALAEMAAACAALSRAVARLAARCHDPLLRRFGALYAALVAGGGDPHGVRYAAARKVDRKARKMQRLVALTAHLGHELDVLAELEQALRRASSSTGRGECARRVARQRQEVERLRAASLWGRTFDYAVRLLARSLFTVVARIVELFGLQPASSVDSSDGEESESSFSSTKVSRLSWSSSFVGGGGMHSMVYPSDVVDTPRRMRSSGSSGKKIVAGADDARWFLMARSRSLRQLRWPAAAGRHLVGCVVAGGRSSPGRDGWVHVHGDADLPLSFSYVSSDEFSTTTTSNSFQFHAAQHTHTRTRARSRPSTTSVFDPSRHDVLASAPATTLGGAGLALHYANLIMLMDRLAASPHDICGDERDALYGMLTASVRAALGTRLRPLGKRRRRCCDPVLAAEWADTVQRILAWLAPLARNMVRWHAERSFEQRSVMPSAGAGVLLLQTLHFADRRKTEAALTELLVGLNYMWRHATMELEAKAGLGGTTAGRLR